MRTSLGFLAVLLLITQHAWCGPTAALLAGKDGVFAWDRYAVAWVHGAAAGAPELQVARQQAAQLLQVGDPGRLASIAYTRLVASLGKQTAPAWLVGTPLGRALDAGAAQLELFVDLSAMARGCVATAEKQGLKLEVRSDIGMLRVADRTYEHRLWLTDVPGRMMWSGQSFVDAWLAMLAEARAALGEYAKLRKTVDRAVQASVQVNGPAFVHEKLPPDGAWRYQEMEAEHITLGPTIRFMSIEHVPLGGRLVQVPLPAGPDPLGTGSELQPILTRPANGYQVGYLEETKDASGWLTPRMAQERGWELEALDERVHRDAAALPLRGYTVAVPALAGKAMFVIGRYASALALYPGALRAVTEGALGHPSRVRAVAATTHALVLTLPDVPREKVDTLRAECATIAKATLGAETAALALELWVDLPADPSGAVSFAPLPNK